MFIPQVKEHKTDKTELGIAANYRGKIRHNGDV